MRTGLKKLVAAVAVSMMATTAVAEITFGVLAPRGALKASEQWSALADYISERTGQTVTFAAEEADQAFANFSNGDYDLFLTNPVQAANLQSQGASLLASLVKKSGKQFAGVIVANANSGISSAADLKGKKVISLSKNAAGGFMFQAVHVTQAGLSVPGDFALHKEGENQDDLVKLVERGVFDAAFVRTGVLEAMEKNGTVDMNNLIIVDEASTDGFALRHSTVLYPEWYMVGAASLDPEIAAVVSEALLALEASAPAADAANISGFVAPIDISPMIEALRLLRVSPFDS